MYVEHSLLFLLDSFKRGLDQASCSLFRKPGSWGPKRLVRVAFYTFFFFSLFTPGESPSMLPDDNLQYTMWNSHHCKISLCKPLFLLAPVVFIVGFVFNVSSCFFFLFTQRSLSHHSLCCTCYERARFTLSQNWACLLSRSKCERFV